MPDPTIKIRKTDVEPEKEEKIIAFTTASIEKFQIEKDIATEIKKRCDEQFGGTWHVIVGKNFGSSITHDTKYVMFFQVDLLCVLIFKSLE